MRFLLFFFLLFSLSLSSQDLALKTKLDKPRSLSTRIGVSLSGPINPYSQAFALSADFPLSDDFHLEGELGYIFNSLVFATFEGETHRGLRTRFGAKYFIDDYFYLSARTKYHFTKTETYYEGLSQGGSYRELKLTERKFHTLGAVIGGGLDIPLAKNKRWILDLFVGGGVLHFAPLDDLVFPESFELTDDRGGLFWNNFTGDFTVVDLSFSMQLEFVLRGK